MPVMYAVLLVSSASEVTPELLIANGSCLFQITRDRLQNWPVPTPPPPLFRLLATWERMSSQPVVNMGQRRCRDRQIHFRRGCFRASVVISDSFGRKTFSETGELRRAPCAAYNNRCATIATLPQVRLFLRL